MNVDAIYNMDCVEGIYKMSQDGNKIDCILSSPPYNITRPNLSDRGYDAYNDRSMTNEQYSNWLCSIFCLAGKILVQNGKILWNMSYGAENTEAMSIFVADVIRKTDFTLADIIVWKKNSAFPNDSSPNRLTRICEFVYVFVRKSELATFSTNKRVVGKIVGDQNAYENKFNIVFAKNNDENCPLNKATYSVDLCGQLLSFYCKQGDTILDPFMGTGTTAIAAKYLDMHYIGFELSDKQCQWAEERLKGITPKNRASGYKQESLF
jgi:DNA modification methylase